MSRTVTPLKFYLKKQDSLLVFEYLDLSCGKRRRRLMPIRGLTRGMSATACMSKAEEVKNHHSASLDFSQVSLKQVARLIRQLSNAVPLEEKPVNVDEGTRATLVQYQEGTIDLNKEARDEVVLAVKQEMNKKFEENVLRPGDEGYVYDKQVGGNVGVKAVVPNDMYTNSALN
jgi:hypothetical protein